MAINIADNMGYNGKKPLDGRTEYATLSAMKSVVDANINEGCLAYNKEDGKYYKFLSTNTVDATTGKWREFETGGGSIPVATASTLGGVKIGSGILVQSDGTISVSGGGGGGSITPSLSVVDIYSELSNVDITVKSDDEIYNVTKNMSSNRYITFDLPWTGDYTVSFVSPTSQLTITKTLNITTLGGYEYYIYDGTEEAITTGTMFESSHYSSNDGSRAFDGNTSTHWIPAQGSSPCWIGRQNVGTYRFTKATVQALIGTSDQSDWIIQGSNDMTTWDDLSLWVMHTSERNKTATFESNGNANTYTSFRMYANSGLAPSVGSGQPSGIQELVFYGISAS